MSNIQELQTKIELGALDSSLFKYAEILLKVIDD